MKQTKQFSFHKITKQSNRYIKNNQRKHYVQIPHQIQSENYASSHTKQDQINGLMLSKVILVIGIHSSGAETIFSF